MFSYTNPYTQDSSRSTRVNKARAFSSSQASSLNNSGALLSDASDVRSTVTHGNPYICETNQRYHRPSPIDTVNEVDLSTRHSSAKRYADKDVMTQASPGSATAQMQELIQKLLKTADTSSVYTAAGTRKRQEQITILSEMTQLLESDAIIAHSSFAWDFESAMVLVHATVASIADEGDDHCIDDANSDMRGDSHMVDESQKNLSAAWKVLQTAITEWWAQDDSLLYTVMIQDWKITGNGNSRTQMSGLDFLEHVACRRNSSSKNLNSQSAAAVCLATMWRTIERMHRRIDSCPLSSRNISISGDRAWWISLERGERYWEPLLSWALTMWMNPSTPQTLNANIHNGVLVDRESGQTAATVFLIQFLQFGCDGWVHDFSNTESRRSRMNDKLQNPSEQFAMNLLDQAERLSDFSMPFSSFAKLAMASLNLILVLEQKQSVSLSPGTNARLKRLTKNPNLWEHLLHQVCKFDSSTDSGEATKWIIPLLHQRMIFDNILQEDLCDSSALKSMWYRIVQQGNHSRDHSIAKRLHLAWDCAPHMSRKALEEALLAVEGSSGKVFNGEVPVGEFLDFLLRGLDGGDDVPANTQYDYASLLRSIFRDSSSRHDDLSQSIWREMTDTRTRCLIESLVNGAKRNDAVFQPTLLALLDSVKLLVTCSSKIAHLVFESTETAEFIISLMKPSEGRMNTAAMDLDETTLSHTSDGSNRSTPTAHNLSRIDADLSVVELRLDTQLRGFDAIIPLTAALVLASATTKTATEESTETLLRSRIQDATSAFISEILESEQNEIYCAMEETPEWTRRMTQLIAECIHNQTHECDNLIASLLHAKKIRMAKDSNLHKKQIERLKYQLQESRERERILTSNNERLARQMEMKESSFVREKGLLEHRTRIELKHLSDDQVKQTKKAESRLRDTTIELHEMRSRAEQAEQEASEHSENHIQAIASLEATEEKLASITSRVEDLQEEHKKCKLVLGEKEKQISATKKNLEGLKEQERKLRDHLRTKDQSLKSMELLHVDMQQSLENLFADMVSLAQLYEMKEKELSSSRKTVDSTIMKLKKELEIERRRNDQLETRQRQTDYDNEVLSKKLARTREKLEDERAARSLDEERKKRSQPVSYINHLHGSSSSSHSRGKENSFGTGNQRRSKHNSRR